MESFKRPGTAVALKLDFSFNPCKNPVRWIFLLHPERNSRAKCVAILMCMRKIRNQTLLLLS
jgi:hypothetical protein